MLHRPVHKYLVRVFLLRFRLTVTWSLDLVLHQGTYSVRATTYEYARVRQQQRLGLRTSIIIVAHGNPSITFRSPEAHQFQQYLSGKCADSRAEAPTAVCETCCLAPNKEVLHVRRTTQRQEKAQVAVSLLLQGCSRYQRANLSIYAVCVRVNTAVTRNVFLSLCCTLKVVL